MTNPLRASFMLDEFCFLVRHKSGEQPIDLVLNHIANLLNKTNLRNDKLFSTLVRTQGKKSIYFDYDPENPYSIPSFSVAEAQKLSLIRVILDEDFSIQLAGGKKAIKRRKAHLLRSLFHLYQVNEPLRKDKTTPIEAISPNWFSPAGPNDPGPVDSGGPGSRPVTPNFNDPCRGGSSDKFDYHFKPKHEAVWWQPNSSPSTNVQAIVGILDSAPQLFKDDEDNPPAQANIDVLKQANVAAEALLTDLRNINFANNPLLQHLIGSGPFTETAPDPALLPFATHTTESVKTLRLRILYDILGILPDEVPSKPLPAIRGHNYIMADHGLFVAGIIDSITENYNIDLNLIEVLNQHGVGTAHTVITGLARFWDDLNRRFDGKDGRQSLADLPVVINASLKFDLPLSVDHKNLNLGELENELARDDILKDLGSIDNRFKIQTGDPTAATTFADFVWQSLNVSRSIINELNFTGDKSKPVRVLIAAAGNDRERPSTPGGNRPNAPYAGYPASEDDAIGVGALDTGDQPTQYSNLADTPVSVGIYTFGGEAPGQPTNLDAGSDDTNQGKGIVGLYLCAFPPAKRGITGIRDTYGWGEWAGTSFATPIITGIAAALVAKGDPTPIATIKGNCEQIIDPKDTAKKTLYLLVEQGNCAGKT